MRVEAMFVQGARKISVHAMLIPLGQLLEDQRAIAEKVGANKESHDDVIQDETPTSGPRTASESGQGVWTLCKLLQILQRMQEVSSRHPC